MTILAILFTLAAMLWMVPLIRSGRLLLLAMAVLLVGTVAGPFLFAFNGPIQLSVDRLMFFAMSILAFVGLRFRVTQLPVLSRMDVLVIGLVGWLFISAATGGSAPPGTPPIARWLFYIAMPAGMYAVARCVRIKTDDIRWMVGGVTVLGLYLSVTAVLEIKGLHGFVFPRYIVSTTNWEFFGRGRGPLLNPAGNGIVIAIALAAAVLTLMSASRDKKLFHAVIVICLLAGIYATLTRSAWIGGLASIGVIGFCYSQRWVRVFGLAAVLLVGGFAATGMKDQILRLKRDKNLSAADAEKSVELRPLLALVAWEMFKDKPLVGHGYGYYFAKHKPYHQDRSYGLPLEQARPYAQHNVFLSILVDTGLIGFSMFSVWVISLLGIAWQLSRDRVASREVRCVGLITLAGLLAYLSNGMFQDVMIIPMVHMFLFFLSGVAVTVAQSGIEVSEQRKKQAVRGTDFQSAAQLG